MLLCALSDASGLGRFDASMLTDQQAIELFYTPKDYDKARKALGGKDSDACTWQDVECDEAQQIVRIDWHESFIKISGSIAFAMMPRHLENLNLYKEDLVGAVDTTALPETLEHFCIEECKFTGTLDLGSLPSCLQSFIVLHNKISAIANMSNLPVGLRLLKIGEPRLDSFPIRVGQLARDSQGVALTEISLGYVAPDQITCENADDRKVILPSYMK